MPRYEFVSGSSAKFWTVTVTGSAVTVTYGRIGTDGQTQTKSHPDAEAANEAAAKLSAQKLKKGYAKVSGKSAPKKKTSKSPSTKKTTSTDDDDEARFARLCLGLAKSREFTGSRQSPTRSFGIDGIHREFAFWQLDGEQTGMHLRYGDPKLIDDDGYEASTARSTSNWMYIRPGAIDSDEVKALIKESHKIAQQRGGGHLAAKKLYFPLKKGYEAATPAARPQSLHAGGPALKIPSAEGPAAFRLGLWAAEHIAHLVPKDESKALGSELERLREARSAYEEMAATATGRERRMGSGYKSMSEVSTNLYQKIVLGDSLPVACAQAVNATFRNIPGGYSQRAIGNAGKAVESAVRALNEFSSDAAVTEFLIELDERAMIEEFNASCIAKKQEISAPIDRVVWRGADMKGYPAFWIARAKNHYAYLGKIGRRWALQEGDLDSIVALVPDELFEAAAMTIYERDPKKG